MVIASGVRSLLAHGSVGNPNREKPITMAVKIQDLSKADDPSQLQSALDDLSEVIEEAEEKGYQIPSKTAIYEAKTPVGDDVRDRTSTLRGISHARG